VVRCPISAFCFLFSDCPRPGRQAGRAALLWDTFLSSDLRFQHVSISAFARLSFSMSVFQRFSFCPGQFQLVSVSAFQLLLGYFLLFRLIAPGRQAGRTALLANMPNPQELITDYG